MESSQFWHLSAFSDVQIKRALSELLGSGYRTEARILAHLAELEDRKLHLKSGSESLFHYCTHVLGLSNSEAFHRITAARIARKFPIVFGLVEQRQLHLTAICLLRDYLTPENHHELLADVCHKTKGQIEELLAHRFPRPDVESWVRKLPARRRRGVPTAGADPKVQTLPRANPPSAAAADDGALLNRPEGGPAERSQAERSQAERSQAERTQAERTQAERTQAERTQAERIQAERIQCNYPAQPQHVPPHDAAQPQHVSPDYSAQPPRTRPMGAQLPCGEPNPQEKPDPVVIQPLSEARYRIQLNASALLKHKLDRLRALTSHSNPSGDIARVIEQALDIALEKVERERFGKTSRTRVLRQKSAPTKPRGPHAPGAVRPESTNSESRRRGRVPNAVLREIAERDGLQCSYRSADGCRCSARAFLQVHHEHPWACGGGETTANLRLLCRAHNQLLAERDFGSRNLALRRDERRRRALIDHPG